MLGRCINGYGVWIMHKSTKDNLETLVEYLTNALETKREMWESKVSGRYCSGYSTGFSDLEKGDSPKKRVLVQLAGNRHHNEPLKLSIVVMTEHGKHFKHRFEIPFLDLAELLTSSFEVMKYLKGATLK